MLDDADALFPSNVAVNKWANFLALSVTLISSDPQQLLFYPVFFPPSLHWLDFPSTCTPSHRWQRDHASIFTILYQSYALAIWLPR